MEKKYLENMVLPVVKTDADCTYCQYLASLFDISSPLCYEYESLKANAARTFAINVDEEESAEFTTLPHILWGCPAEGIRFDSAGGTYELKIRSGGPFIIE